MIGKAATLASTRQLPNWMSERDPSARSYNLVHLYLRCRGRRLYGGAAEEALNQISCCSDYLPATCAEGQVFDSLWTRHSSHTPLLMRRATNNLRTKLRRAQNRMFVSHHLVALGSVSVL